MVSALQQLQKIHDEAGEAGKAEITIERATFKAITTSINEAYEQIKQYKESENKPVATEESPVLDTLKKIQASITILEQKYESIETKVTEAPKTYAEMIKSTSISPELKDKKIMTSWKQYESDMTNTQSHYPSRQSLPLCKRRSQKCRVLILPNYARKPSIQSCHQVNLI